MITATIFCEGDRQYLHAKDLFFKIPQNGK